jgi:hypothetical protein
MIRTGGEESLKNIVLFFGLILLIAILIDISLSQNQIEKKSTNSKKPDFNKITPL